MRSTFLPFYGVPSSSFYILDFATCAAGLRVFTRERALPQQLRDMMSGK